MQLRLLRGTAHTLVVVLTFAFTSAAKNFNDGAFVLVPALGAATGVPHRCER